MRWILIVMDSKTEVCPTVDIIWGNNHYIALFNVILTIMGQYPFHTSTRQKHLRQTKKNRATRGFIVTRSRQPSRHPQT